MGDYVMTLDSDSEDISPKNPKSRPAEAEDTRFDPNFSFDITGDPYLDLIENAGGVDDFVKSGTKPVPISVDEIIARRRLKLKRKRGPQEDSQGTHSEEFDQEESDNDEEATDADSSASTEDDPLATSDEAGIQDDSAPERDSQSDSDDDSTAENETEADRARKLAFFASEDRTAESHESFLSMNLSRPILKAISGMGFQKPTPIQSATIPVALLGKDVVGNAVTGSGKTAAFMIPMLERLLYREKGKKAAATRCLVLLPTRELAVQCYEVGKRLATHTDVQLCLLVGGLSLKSQETALRARPDIVLATPGRLIDHVRNSPDFTLDAIDILVLDEADRMLSEGFADELAEIVKSCPQSRQTMLFSATMTDSVDELVKMSLNKPVRLFVDPKRSMARGLVQEFVRVRAGKENERSALLVALCKRNFKNNVIVFLRSKKLAHQMRIVFSLLGMKCEELHGDLSQEQRLQALRHFRDGSVDYLMATDLAARGLDIKGVETVINFDMPSQLAQYMHRVGRTARAGKQGRSVTLVGEADRKMLKAAIKHAAGDDQVRHRVVPSDVVQTWVERLENFKSEIADVLQEEKEEKHLRRAEMELKKGQNIIEHEAEIYSRPARTWFQSTKEKEKSKEVSKQVHEVGYKPGSGSKATDNEKPKRDKFSGLSRKAKRRKLTMEQDNEMGDEKAVNAAIRSAKKSSKPSKIGVLASPSKLRTHKSKLTKKRRTTSNFDGDLADRGKHQEGIRAIKGDIPKLNKKMGKRKGKGK